MKKLLKCVIIVIIIVAIVILGINLYVKLSTSKQIIKENDYSELSDVDCIIILGAGIWGDKPSPMLEDRLLKGIELFQNNVLREILARNKDFIKCIFKPSPTYLGDTIPVSENGDVTNDGK